MIQGHKLLVVTKRMRCEHKQLKLICSIVWLDSPLETGWDVSSQEGRRLLHVERSQLVTFLGRFYQPREGQSRPRTHWRHYISQLVREDLGILLEQLQGVAGEREV